MKPKVNEEYLQPLKSKEQFYSDWKEDTIQSLKKRGTLDEVYNTYWVRWNTFKRDNYECQVEGCKFTDSPLTMHHYRHYCNGGDTKLRNCVTVCSAHQNRYHRGKEPLIYKGGSYLPAHIRGKTQVLDLCINGKPKKVISTVDRQRRLEMATLRKQNKHLWGRILSWIEVAILMTFLFGGVSEWSKEPDLRDS